MSGEGCENSLSASPPTPAEGVRRIQIYSSPTSSSSRQVTSFWKDKYERDAKKYWDMFYRRHKDRFFKDRHYLDKEWGRHFQVPEGEKLVVLEERLTSKEQQIDENFYVRGDGTRAYYFSTSFLKNLFTQNGFDVEEVGVCNKQVENRSRELVMNRRWIQAVFTTNSLNTKKTDTTLVGLEENEQKTNHEIHGDQSSSNPAIGIEIDLSETIAEMFGISRSYDELNEINPKGYTFKIKGLAKEYQHTCKSTGLILWDSARLMCNILAENPSIVSGKKVLELGCGSAGICSMVAVHSAQLVVATDGDTDALDLLKQNAISNIDPTFINNMVMKKLMWGDRDDIEAIKDLYCHDGGFEVIVGTDVTYSPPAIDPLFETAKELILIKVDEKTKPTLILCHMQRRVHEDSIILSASKAGFRLVDRWMNGMESNVGVINSWFSNACSLGSFRTSPLSILYFNCA